MTPDTVPRGHRAGCGLRHAAPGATALGTGPPAGGTSAQRVRPFKEQLWRPGCLAGSRTGGAWGARLCGFAVGGWRRGPGGRGVGQKHRPGPRTPLCLLLTGQPPTRQLEPSVPSAGQAPWPGAGHPLSAPHPHYSSRRLRVASCGSLDPIDPAILGALRGGQPWQVGRRRALGCWARWSAQGPGQPAAHHTTLFR